MRLLLAQQQALASRPFFPNAPNREKSGDTRCQSNRQGRKKPNQRTRFSNPVKPD